MGGDKRAVDHDLMNLRFEYAWRYFESAARQRMLFFNYFLIAVGILASAYGFSIKEKLYPLAFFVCLFGLFASVAFVVLDMRMLAFVERGLWVLEALEREYIFPDGYEGGVVSDDRTKQLGLARIEPDRKASGTTDWKTGHAMTKVKFWIRLVEIVAALGFASGLIYTIT